MTEYKEALADAIIASGKKKYNVDDFVPVIWALAITSLALSIATTSLKEANITY